MPTDGIRERIEAWTAVGSPLDTGDAMSAALLAILDLHTRQDGEAPSLPECYCGENWPCPTVRAISEAFKHE